MNRSTPLPAWWRTSHLPWTLGILLALLAWDALALDRAMAHWFGTSEGFALRDHWLLSTLLHDGARRLGWALLGALLLSVWWPVGVLRRLHRSERTGLLVGTVLALLAVGLFKAGSRTSCPWDLAEFGGALPYVSHWQWQLADGGGGHCFPAGHASTGFAFVAGYFWLRATAPRAARAWLGAALVAGLGLGLVQQLRGAHFMSHTLWSGWLCWSVASLSHALWQRALAVRVALQGRRAGALRPRG